MPSSDVLTPGQPSAGSGQDAGKAAEKQEVKGYFETTGFDRWNRIYSDSDDVNKVQRNIRIGRRRQPDAAPGPAGSRLDRRLRPLGGDGAGGRAPRR